MTILRETGVRKVLLFFYLLSDQTYFLCNFIDGFERKGKSNEK